MLALLADIDVSMVAVEPASEAESLTEPASEARECPSDAVAEKSGTGGGGGGGSHISLTDQPSSTLLGPSARIGPALAGVMTRGEEVVSHAELLWRLRWQHIVAALQPD